MNFTSKSSLKTITASLALLVMPLGYSQIPDSELDSIFTRLNGDDFDARYEARMDLQNQVSEATKPGNESQQPLVEQQLLERLEKEPLLTTKLWILRQLSSIGSEASLPALEKLAASSDAKLADGARMAINRITPVPSAEGGLYLGFDVDELATLASTDDSRAVRNAAFAKLAAIDSRKAISVMKEALESDSSSSADFLKAAMVADSRSLNKAALAELASGKVQNQIVILGALEGRASSKLEKQLIALLDTENETLKLQTVEALGRVGTVKSLEPVLELTNSKDRDLSTAAADTLASISDKRIDSSLLKAAKKGSVEDRITALNALSYRASAGVTELVNEMAADDSLDEDLREAAIESMESVGDLASLPILVDIVVSEESGLRKDAQKTLKRMTLRTNDPAAAWNAFSDGLKASENDSSAKLALMLVLDSAPSKEAIEYLNNEWKSGDAEVQKTILKVLPSWRNWDGGYLLLDLAKQAGDDQKIAGQCIRGIGRIILGSDSSFPIRDKYKLANQALDLTDDASVRSSILNSFRDPTWQDKRFVENNEVNPEIKAKVLES
ncbi:HEAT repeat domain-containing protein [Pelagicoccus mobilis]|uniref:HEAT repeat domain-containing protein n=1 Tax=Pelagicoccus mobilis TaxID=415221 RepID=A0A934RS25_9BACT|nr:HEAT repeat domain-containing protein [Pelagicoccus mobilis]MBK1875837.1 HEAT repeat domain-containing protein [Pelagicoccus mobilis]